MTDNRRDLRPEDIPIGEPLPWRVLHADGQLLLEVGAIVPSASDRDFLFRQFTPRRDETHNAAADDVVGDLAADAMQQGGVSGFVAPGLSGNDRTTITPVRLGEMGLPIGARLGVRSSLSGMKTTHASRLIGFAPNESIFITPPQSDSARLSLGHGETVEVVAISSRAVFLFMCSVDSVATRPFPYIVLSKPGVVRRVRERRTDRVKTRLAVLFHGGAGEGGVQRGLGVVNDISDLGLAIASATPVGRIGETIHLAFHLDMDATAMRLEVDGVIRNIKPMKLDDEDMPMQEYGLEFVSMPAESRFALRSFVLSYRSSR